MNDRMTAEAPGNAGMPAWKLLSKSAHERGENGKYYEHARGDLIDLFSPLPALLLDIGCGSGATSAEVKRRSAATKVIGVEVQEEAANAASSQLDKVIRQNAEQVDFAAEGVMPNSIDGLLLADVLEHMYDPWRFLVNVRPFLAPGAQIVASIPNVQNLWLLDQIARGNFSYEAEGLLDVTHIRFFTRREILRMFHETGYEVRALSRCFDGRLGAIPLTSNGLINIDTASMTIKGIDQEAMLDLKTSQFYVTAVPGPATETKNHVG